MDADVGEIRGADPDAAAAVPADCRNDASSKTPEEVQKKVKAKYPELQLDVILQIGAGAAFAK